MRIRKRKVPFPLSSLSPIPLSDPHLSGSPVVQLQLQENPQRNLYPDDDTAAYFDPQPPSDQPNQPIGSHTDFSDTAGLLLLQGDKVLLQEAEKNNNDTRKASFLGAQIETGTLNQQSNSSNQGEDNTFPLKKRRGSLERRLWSEETITEKDKKMKTKMKAKIMKNKECEQIDDDTIVREDNKEEIKEGIDRNSSAKKKARGGALMEGSRCSRVNGRGWRCCQQTLVGYSLCEHHLGKGRLRSMTSVRKRSVANSSIAKKEDSWQPSSSTSIVSSQQEEAKQIMVNDKKVDNACENEDDQDQKPLTIAKKRMKLGMVKARSISSLLGQGNNNTMAVAEDNE